MVNPVLEIRALLSLEPGDRLFYDCPIMSGDFGSMEADEFFKKRRGQVAIYNGPASEFVGLLDRSGRLPGKYCNPKGASVTFPDGLVRTLNILHLVAVEPRIGTTKTPDRADLSLQRLDDLPEPIVFYPGDTVAKLNDLLGEVRTIQEVTVESKDGSVRYGLARQKSAGPQQQPAAAETQRTRMMFDLSHLPGEYVRRDEIQLIERGHLYYAYNEPEMPAFATPADEVNFWFQSGVSERILTYHEYAQRIRAGDAVKPPPRTQAESIEALRSGRMDLLRVNPRRARPRGPYEPGVEVIGESDFEFAVLLAPFQQFSERARSACFAYWEEYGQLSA